MFGRVEIKPALMFDWPNLIKMIFCSSKGEAGEVLCVQSLKKKKTATTKPQLRHTTIECSCRLLAVLSLLLVK